MARSNSPAASRGSTLRRGRGVAVALAVAGLSMAVSSAVPAYATVSSDTSPNFGPNVTIFDPSESTTDINAAFAAAGGYSQFGTDRHAFLFKPGTYGSAAGQADPTTATGVVNGDIGYYESVAGLSESPTGVTINGAIHSEGQQTKPSDPWDDGDEALNNFWRSLSNVTINPIQQPTATDAERAYPEGIADAHTLRWAVSQASPLRRVNVEGDLSLFPRFGSYSSGGYISGSKVSGQVISGSQQQWYTRDSNIGSWSGSVWNMVFSGVTGAPAQSFPTPADTTLASTPESRDAPFLYIDDSGKYNVFVPNVRTNASDVDWSTADGTSLPIHDFYIAQQSSTATEINHALAEGKNLILTPGVYNLSSSIRVTRSNTVILGMGFATLTPKFGQPAITTGNVHGVKISGIIVDAGATNSATLIRIGSKGASNSSASDPTTLNDVFFRIGGAHKGKATTSLEVNSSHVILDDIWAWRADHGNDGSVGWNVNTAAHGLVVNGNYVTAEGLAVEHYQKAQVQWNGNHGTTIFYQSELPYDPPTQASWMDGTKDGYASYAVAKSVTSHKAYGLGVYSNFTAGPSIFAANAITAPENSNVTFADLVTIFLNGNGGITNVINGTGAAVQSGSGQTDVTSYPPADTQNPVLHVTAHFGHHNASGAYKSVTFTLKATDDFLPAPTFQASVDSGAWKTVKSGYRAPRGEHTIEIRAVDSSGNDSDVYTWTGTVS